MAGWGGGLPLRRAALARRPRRPTAGTSRAAAGTVQGRTASLGTARRSAGRGGWVLGRGHRMAAWELSRVQFGSSFLSWTNSNLVGR
jgi:hypothetical protein